MYIHIYIYIYKYDSSYYVTNIGLYIYISMKISPENISISSRYRRGQVLQLGADLHRARLRPGGAGRPGRGSNPGVGWKSWSRLDKGSCEMGILCEIYRFK